MEMERAQNRDEVGHNRYAAGGAVFSQQLLGENEQARNFDEVRPQDGGMRADGGRIGRFEHGNREIGLRGDDEFGVAVANVDDVVSKHLALGDIGSPGFGGAAGVKGVKTETGGLAGRFLGEKDDFPYSKITQQG